MKNTYFESMLSIAFEIKPWYVSLKPFLRVYVVQTRFDVKQKNVFQ